jgi:hypothetical protein
LRESRRPVLVEQRVLGGGGVVAFPPFDEFLGGALGVVECVDLEVAGKVRWVEVSRIETLHRGVAREMRDDVQCLREHVIRRLEGDEAFLSPAGFAFFTA